MCDGETRLQQGNVFFFHSYLKKKSNSSKIFSLNELKCTRGKCLPWKGLILLCTSAGVGDILMLWFEHKREGQFGCESRMKNQNCRWFTNKSAPDKHKDFWSWSWMTLPCNQRVTASPPNYFPCHILSSQSYKLLGADVLVSARTAGSESRMGPPGIMEIQSRASAIKM